MPQEMVGPMMAKSILCLREPEKNMTRKPLRFGYGHVVAKARTARYDRRHILDVGTEVAGLGRSRRTCQDEYMTAPERFADCRIPLAPSAPSVHGTQQSRVHVAAC